VLVTTHYMDEALFCDRLALMDRGEIIASGTPQDLLARPVPTPLIELRLSDDAGGADWIGALPEVREVLPRAGRLRVRLHAGSVPEQFIAKAIEDGARRGLTVQADAHAAPELEDVFVSLLEAQEKTA